MQRASPPRLQEEPVYSNATFPQKTWHHVAVTFEVLDRGQYFDPNSGTISHRLGKIYVNGDLQATFETRLFDMAKPTIIAGAEYKQYAKQSHFSGLMDELRVFGSVLSATSVQDLAFTASTPQLNAANILWHVKFDDFKHAGANAANKGDMHDKVSNASAPSALLTRSVPSWFIPGFILLPRLKEALIS